MTKFLTASGRKEAKNAFWLIGGKVIQMILSLMVGVLTARYLGPSNYGLISYGTAFVSFFSALSTLGLNSIIIKDFVDYPDEKGEAIGSAIMLRLFSSVLSALMIICVVSIIDKDEPLTVVIVALCSLSLIFHVFETISFWFQEQYKSKITAIITLIAYIGTSMYKLFLLAAGKDVRWFAFASSVDYIVVAVLLLIAYKRHNGEKLRFSFSKSKQLLNLSYHYILSSVAVAVYNQTNKLMLKQILDKSEVAYFSTAVAICSMWTFVLQAIIDSIYPTILNMKNKDQDLYNKKNRQLYSIVFYITVAVAVFFAFFGDFVVNLLYGKAYAPASTPLKIVTLYTAFSYLGVARNAWIVSEGKQRYLKYIYLSAAVLNVICNCYFIPLWGASGAAFASLLTQVATSMFLPCFFKEMRPNVVLMLEAILLKDMWKRKKL